MTVQRLFLAASRRSAGLLTALVGDLQGLGYAVILDTSLPGGDAWWASTMEALESSVLSFTPSRARRSSRISADWRLERAEAIELPVLPVLLDSELSDIELPAALGKIQRTDYRSADRAGLAELFRSLDGLATTRSVGTAHPVDPMRRATTERTPPSCFPRRITSIPRPRSGSSPRCGTTSKDGYSFEELHQILAISVLSRT